MPMDFDQLETFLEVARHSSFSRAAERRFRTQPAISSQIRALEEEIGARMLDRSGGKVSLTAAGKVFLKYAEETLGAAPRHADRDGGDGARAARRNSGGRQRRHLPAHPPRGFCRIQAAVPRRGSQRKATRNTPRFWKRSSRTPCDFGVVSMPVTDKRLHGGSIHRDELVVITPPRHPLSKQKKVTLADSRQSIPLLLPKIGRTRDMHWKRCSTNAA